MCTVYVLHVHTLHFILYIVYGRCLLSYSVLMWLIAVIGDRVVSLE